MECVEIAEAVDCLSCFGDMVTSIFDGEGGRGLVFCVKLIGLGLDIAAIVTFANSNEQSAFDVLALFYLIWNRVLAVITFIFCCTWSQKPVDYDSKSVDTNTWFGAQWNGLDALSKLYVPRVTNGQKSCMGALVGFVYFVFFLLDVALFVAVGTLAAFNQVGETIEVFASMMWLLVNGWFYHFEHAMILFVVPTQPGGSCRGIGWFIGITIVLYEIAVVGILIFIQLFD